MASRKKSRRRRNPSDLEVREKFDRCVASVRAKSGKRHLTKAGRYARITSPEAICAKSIRRTSRKQLARISGEGRSLAAARRHRRGLVRSRKTGRLVHRPMSRIRKTAIERRGLLGRVMRQQKLAKIRAKRQMGRRNPSKGLHIYRIYSAVYKGTKGYAVVDYRDGYKYAVIFSRSGDSLEHSLKTLKRGGKFEPMILRGVSLKDRLKAGSFQEGA